MLGTYKVRRQTLRENKKDSKTSKNNGSFLLHSNSSRYREPVSHVSGAFKKTLDVSIIY
jgi:hypothetical protein